MSPNPHIAQRLAGIFSQLMGIYESNRSLSSSTKGSERESFVSLFLEEVFPRQFRFGTGDATDAEGNRSGQLDVVIEFPFAPSLPVVGKGQTRLYLAESIAAVVEVKSNAANQWQEAKQTAEKLLSVQRSFASTMSWGPGVPVHIPMFVVAYTGWATLETIDAKLKEAPGISGILIIDRQLFVSSEECLGLKATGPWSLWGLICCIDSVTQSLNSAISAPLKYAAPTENREN